LANNDARKRVSSEQAAEQAASSKRIRAAFRETVFTEAISLMIKAEKGPTGRSAYGSMAHAIHRDKQRTSLQEFMRIEQLIKNSNGELNFDKWNQKDCKAYLVYYKKKGDLKAPTKMAELRERCRVVRDEHRRNPLPPVVDEYDQPDNDDSGSDDENVSVSSAVY
jgi:hypothetical protein